MAIDKRKSPEVNAGSMADIAFLLLIFFLVATTMNVDSGINRVLPPWSNEQQDAPDIKERNLLKIYVNKYDAVMANGEVIHLSQLKDLTKGFIMNATDDQNLPEKEEKEIDLIGTYQVSKGVISLQNDRETSYDMYIKVQNELTKAINEIRNDLANEKFGSNYSELEEAQRNAIAAAVKQSISEAEPKDIK